MDILDLSKTLMCKFPYNYIKKNYGRKTKLFFTYTGKLTFKIETNDVQKDFYKDKDKVEFRMYPENSKTHDDTKVIRKTKHGTESVSIIEFVGLKSKTYSHV